MSSSVNLENYYPEGLYQTPSVWTPKNPNAHYPVLSKLVIAGTSLSCAIPILYEQHLRTAPSDAYSLALRTVGVGFLYLGIYSLVKTVHGSNSQYFIDENAKKSAGKILQKITNHLLGLDPKQLKSVVILAESVLPKSLSITIPTGKKVSETKKEIVRHLAGRLYEQHIAGKYKNEKGTLLPSFLKHKNNQKTSTPLVNRVEPGLLDFHGDAIISTWSDVYIGESTKVIRISQNLNPKEMTKSERNSHFTSLENIQKSFKKGQKSQNT